MQNHLIYLQDKPRYDENWLGDIPDDKFKHSGYTEGLYNFIKECKPPFCFGLFGGWGTGKTGIVLGLKNYIETKNVDIKCLYFDVWEYSADSLRRQLLLKIDEVWFENKLNFKNHLYVNTKKTAVSTNSIDWRKFWKLNLWLTPVYIFLVTMVYCMEPIGWMSKNDKWLDMFGVVLIPLLIAIISSFQNKNELETIVEDSSKPNSPEEFENLFKIALNDNSIKEKRKVFIIDNLDRCNSDRVMEVLTGISTFLDQKNCIYIIPCDENRIKDHVKKQFNTLSSDDSTFEEEFIRKLFNAHITLRPVHEDNLIGYLNDLVNKIGLINEKEKENLITILFSGVANNPRKAKQLLNNFVSSYNMALDIESQPQEESSLASGIISGNPSFLLKIIVIQNYFPNSYLIFLKNPGLFNSFSESINLTKSDETISLNAKFPELANLKNEYIGLIEFIEATTNINSVESDVFIRFYGRPNSKLDTLVKNAFNSAARNSHDELFKNIEENISNIDYLKAFNIHTEINLKSIAYTMDLKLNVINSLLKVSYQVKSDVFDEMIGKIIEKVNNITIRYIGCNIDQQIWVIWDKGFINSAKMETIVRMIYSASIVLYNNIVSNSALSLEIIWQTVNEHIKRVNTYRSKFNGDLIEQFTTLLLKILINDLKRDAIPIKEAWVWLINEKPSITQNKKFIEGIVNELPNKINEQFDLAGSFIVKSNNVAEKDSIEELFLKLIDLFTIGMSDIKSNSDLFPPNLALHFVILSNRKFTNKSMDQLVEKLYEYNDVLLSEGYILETKWFHGFVEIYDFLNANNKILVTNILNKGIQSNPEIYELGLDNTNYYYNKSLNIELFKTAVSIQETNVIENSDKWKVIISKIIDSTFQFDINSIFIDFIEVFKSFDNLYERYIYLYIIEVISENINTYKDVFPFIKKLMIKTLDVNLWIYEEDKYKKMFLQSIFKMLDTVSISEFEKDNLIDPILRNEYQELDFGVKDKLREIRVELFKRISESAKQRVLNNIWTKSDNKLTNDNIDIQFLFDNFQHLENSDKQEVYKELFDQLNINNTTLFNKYGFYNNIMSYQPNDWLARIAPYLDYEGITEKVKEKIITFQDSNEKSKILVILYPKTE